MKEQNDNYPCEDRHGNMNKGLLCTTLLSLDWGDMGFHVSLRECKRC